MSDTTDAIVLALFILATSIWVGGYVAIVLVARTAGAVLDGPGRVAFFRSLGRAYLRVGLPSLIVALALGGLLARDLEWDALLVTTIVVAGVLLASLGVAVAQARRMTRLRRRALATPDDAELREGVRRGALAAGILRGVLGLLTLVLIVLGAFLAT